MSSIEPPGGEATGWRRAVHYLMLIALVLLAVEAGASVLLVLRYRNQVPVFVGEGYRPSTLLLLKRGLARWIPEWKKVPEESVTKQCRPAPSVGGDPAVLERIVCRWTKKVGQTATYFEAVESKEAGGARYTGRKPEIPARQMYVLGDSFVWGVGVNDEQTFSYLLQARMPSTAVHLLAGPGEALVESMTKVLALEDQLGPQDVVLLGYADWYKERHVAAPSRLRQINRWMRARYPEREIPADMKHVKASLDASGALVVGQVNANCEVHPESCSGRDPASAYMDDVAVAILERVAAATRARVLLLHFEGPKDDPVLKRLPDRISLVPATPSDFDRVIRDDVMGFDPHPGPYWHHAMFTRLLDTMRSNGLEPVSGSPASPEAP